MILNDVEIKELAKRGFIVPFCETLVRRIENRAVLSYGLSSYGYDLRLSSKEFKVFRHVPGRIVDPKDFYEGNLESARLHCDESGEYFILPGNSYGLGVAVERLDLPANISGLCLGKSTYARCGIIANLTPAEAGWRGHLTLEFSNASAADCRLYVNEGIVQMLFFRGEPCEISYGTRLGKYQNQSENIISAKV